MILIISNAPLGDENNIYRCHLLYLLQNNIINNQTVIINSCIDRHFLYTNHFNNIFISIESAYSSLPHIKDYPCYELFSIFPFPKLPYSIIDKSTIVNEELYKKLFNTSLMPSIYYNNVKNENLLNMLIDIPKYDIIKCENYNKLSLMILNKFIIIHHRNKKNEHTIWDNEITDLITIINFVFKKTKNIIIFGNINKCDINKCDIDNIYFTDNLQLYTTLLNNENCTSLITQWSGGGQLCSYVGNKNIELLFYFNKHQGHYYDFIKNNETEIHVNENCFDFINPLNISRTFYKSINELTHQIAL